MEEQKSITLKTFDNRLQKSSSITINVGDKYKDTNKLVWECKRIDSGHIMFVQDINIEYNWSVPDCQRNKPYYILTYEQAKWFLPCPVRNWIRTNEATKTIKY